MQKTRTNRRLNYLFVGLLCSLVVFFAIGAKVAVYHPGQANQPITASKMWDSNPDPTVQALPALSVLVSTLFLSALFALSFAPAMVSYSLAVEQAAPLLQCWSSPHLSVRPPPSL